ncbi:hypothetical protein C7B16_19870 [Escherichia sp. 20412-1]|nr:hypothetical protein C7B16_19870 [Escherichia sp. 20412-1]
MSRWPECGGAAESRIGEVVSIPSFAGNAKNCIDSHSSSHVLQSPLPDLQRAISLSQLACEIANGTP